VSAAAGSTRVARSAGNSYFRASTRPSSASIIRRNDSIGWAPTGLRPLMKKVGVPAAPSEGR